MLRCYVINDDYTLPSQRPHILRRKHSWNTPRRISSHTIHHRKEWSVGLLHSRRFAFCRQYLCIVIGTPTYISAGFKSQAVFVGLAIRPIYLLGNTIFESYAISPALDSGLSLNTSGLISGVYSGQAMNRVYQITGTNSFGSISDSFTLEYKRSVRLLF